MQTNQIKPKTIDEYIAGFPLDIQEILEKIRATIKKSAPDAHEAIKYQMPTFTLKGNLVYFAAFKKHIGFFPPTTGDEKFQREIAPYAGEKGNLRFPLNEPIPYALIAKIVKMRVKEDLAKAAAKDNRKK